MILVIFFIFPVEIKGGVYVTCYIVTLYPCNMMCKCERCHFEITMSRYKFETMCFEQPYCPKCGQYMDESLEDEVL